MNKTLKISNFIIQYLNQEQHKVTYRSLGNILYIVAGNYYLKYRQLLLDEPFYRIGVGYQLDSINTAFNQAKQHNLQPQMNTKIKLSNKEQNFIVKQLAAITDFSYNKLAVQCSKVNKKLHESKLKLINYEKEKA